jgi:hypothetical protein
MNRAVVDYARYAGQMFGGFRVRHEKEIFNTRESDIKGLFNSQKLKVLDLANGWLRPQFSLMSNAGHDVTGVDFVNAPQGVKGLLHAFCRKLFRLQAGIGKIENENQKLLVARVEDLPSSVAAFEHFLEMPRVISELKRVCKPGGIVWTRIHLFTGLSGGHNVSLTQIPITKLPCGVDAWDHLRKRKIPFHVPLNEWRINQYLKEFEKHFTILKHYCDMKEGEEFLTNEIQKELSDYSKEELTCRSYVIVAKKESL